MASTSRIERPCTPELHDFDMGTSSTLISIQTPSPPSVNDLSFELSSKLKLDESRDGESKSPSNAVLDIKRTGIAYDARMKRHFHPHTKHFECPERYFALEYPAEERVVLNFDHYDMMRSACGS